MLQPTVHRRGSGLQLQLTDAPAVAGLSSGQPGEPSEYHFANLWLFRERHDYRFCDGPVPHIRGITYDGARHALPLVPLDGSIARALFAEGVDCLYPFGAGGDILARELGLDARFEEADSDYWFRAANLAKLAGAKERRAQAKAFEREARPSVERWTTGLAADALAILEGWAADVARPESATDLAECRAAIAQADVLALEGMIVRTEAGEAVAFLLASRSGSVRTIHFAKGRRAWSGAYPFLFSRFAASPGAEWINFEQDLGNPGLAQSKRAYAPHYRQPKWRLTPPA